MKRKLLFTAMVALALNAAKAQPEIQLEDFTPEFETQIGYRYAEFQEQGLSGENVIWNFNDLILTGDSILNIVQDAEDQGNVNSFSNPTHYFYTLDNNEPDYFWRFSNDTVEVLGFDGVLPGSFDYSNPQIVLVFPLTYSDTFNDSYQYTVGNGQSALTKYVEFTAETDAYGSLTIPSGTFENVVRVRYDMEITHTEYSGGTSSTYDFTTTRWLYLNPDFPHSLAQVSRSISKTDTSYYGYFYDPDIVSNVQELSMNQLALSVYPSPAKDFVKVAIGSNKATEVQVQLLHQDGKVIVNYGERHISGHRSNLRFDLPDLPGGVYLLRVSENENTVVKRIAITH